MAESNLEVPYLRSTRSVLDLATALRRSLPTGDIVTSEYIVAASASGVTDKTAKNTLSDLRKFGFISEDGHLTQRGLMLRSADNYPVLAEEILKQYFPQVLDILKLNADDWQSRLEKYLIDKTRAGEPVRIKIRATVGFFWNMHRGTEPSIKDKPSASGNKVARETGANSGQRTTRQVPVSGTQGSQPVQESSKIAAGQSNIPLYSPHAYSQTGLDVLTSVLRITIDGTWDLDRINLVFDRLERLLDPSRSAESQPETANDEND